MLSFKVFQEGPYYIASMKEHDLMVQADSIKEAIGKLANLLHAYEYYDEPWESIKPCPEAIWNSYRDKKVIQENV